jgi:hypothetical protein
MSHSFFKTSQHLSPLDCGVAGNLFIAGANHRAGLQVHEASGPGTLLPFLKLLLGIGVSADVGHAG